MSRGLVCAEPSGPLTITDQSGGNSPERCRTRTVTFFVRFGGERAPFRNRKSKDQVRINNKIPPKLTAQIDLQARSSLTETEGETKTSALCQGKTLPLDFKFKSRLRPSSLETHEFPRAFCDIERTYRDPQNLLKWKYTLSD